MPCCGLIAFLLGQPMLLWRGIRSWLGGAPLGLAFGSGSPWTVTMAGGIVIAELALFTAGAGLSLYTRQLDARISEAAFLPIGRICSIFSGGN